MNVAIRLHPAPRLAFALACLLALVFAAPPRAAAADSLAVAADSVAAPARDSTVDADGYTFPAPPPKAPASSRHGPVRPALGTIVGVVATLGPPALALALTRPDDRWHAHGDAALLTGAGIGYLAGPALGFWSSGRPRRALMGLAVRGGGAALFGLGLVVGNNLNDPDELENLKGALGAVILCVAGTALGAASLGYDLYSLPHRGETDEKLVATGLVVRPDGKVALTARF